jgi:hypothetical protein
MTPGKVLFAGAAFSASLFLLSVPAFAAPLANCKEPKTGTKAVPIFSPPRAAVVVGIGRLQFYSAPRVRCPLNGVFVVPKDQLVVYAQTDDGWSSVMFINARTGDSVSGWVRSARLKDVGTVGPEQ